LANDDFPAETVRFIRAHIRSLGQLEILLLLHGAPESSWTAAQITAELRSSLDSVTQRLAALESSGLVATDAADPQYRYAPATDELADHVAELGRLYRDYRERLIDTIYSSQEQLRNFSDAFRWRKDSGNDG